MLTSTTRKTKRRRSARGAKRPAVTHGVRHIAEPIREARDAADRNDTAPDTAVIPSLERDVDSEEATQVEAIFQDPSRVDDDAIINDADGTNSRRR